MSIMMCEECDMLVDSDYEEMFQVKGKIVCDDCKEKEEEKWVI